MSEVVRRQDESDPRLDDEGGQYCREQTGLWIVSSAQDQTKMRTKIKSIFSVLFQLSI